METLSAIAGIVLIDILLSGDNVIVIALAAHRLPPRQRRLAILLGGGAAILLRIALTAVASLLLTLPGLQAAGGLLLLWIAFRLLKEEEAEAEGDSSIKEGANLREAILTILLADLIMCLDNVLGVAAFAQGQVELLVFGLALSVAILMLGGSLIADLLNRWWWLAYLGAAVIAWTGADMLLRDRFIERLGVPPTALHLAITLVLASAVVLAAHLVHRPRPARALS